MGVAAGATVAAASFAATECGGQSAAHDERAALMFDENMSDPMQRRKMLKTMQRSTDATTGEEMSHTFRDLSNPLVTGLMQAEEQDKKMYVQIRKMLGALHIAQRGAISFDEYLSDEIHSADKAAWAQLDDIKRQGLPKDDVKLAPLMVKECMACGAEAMRLK